MSRAGKSAGRLLARAAILSIAAVSAFEFSPIASATTFTKPSYYSQIGHAGKAFVYPWGIATALDGTLLVGDYVNLNVKRFDTAGNFLNQFGHGGKNGGQFQQPNSVAVDPVDGSIYVSDPDRSQYQKFTPSGVWLYTVTVAAPDLAFGICYDAFLRVAANQNVYTVCSHGGTPGETFRVMVYDKDGNQLQELGTNGSGPGQFMIPRGIDFDSAGNIYIADTGNHRIDVFDPSFNFLYSFGKAGKTAGKLGVSVRGLVVDKVNGWVYVTDATNGTVHKFTLSGTWLMDIGFTGTDPGQFVGPRQTTLDAAGNLYVTDYAGWRVEEFDSNGNFINQIPNPPIPAPLGGFSMPNGIAIDNATNTLYVADSFNQRVQKFTTSGTALFSWGTRTLPRNGPYNINYPRGIAVDPRNSNVWLMDTRSGIVKEYDQNGTYISQFGNQGFSPPDAEPEFEWNWGATVGPDGSLYIADIGNFAIKVFDQSGNMKLFIPCGIFPTTALSVIAAGCMDVTIDESGNIWAADGSEHLVKEWDPNGNLLQSFGSSSNLGQESGIAVRHGLVYITASDRGNVVVFDTSGNQVGTFGSSGSGNGQFNGGKAIRIANDGKIYVVDGGNNRIEVFCCAA